MLPYMAYMDPMGYLIGNFTTPKDIAPRCTKQKDIIRRMTEASVTVRGVTSWSLFWGEVPARHGGYPTAGWFRSWTIPKTHGCWSTPKFRAGNLHDS